MGYNVRYRNAQPWEQEEKQPMYESILSNGINVQLSKTIRVSGDPNKGTLFFKGSREVTRELDLET